MISAKMMNPAGSILQVEKAPGVYAVLETGDDGWEEAFAIASPHVPRPNPRMDGVHFQGVMCSATADDQNGLTAVLLAIQLQGPLFPGTRFLFANGTALDITYENHQAFIAVWLPFRQTLFAIES